MDEHVTFVEGLGLLWGYSRSQKSLATPLKNARKHPP